MAATAGGSSIRSFTEDEFPGLCDRVAAVDPDLKAIVDGLGYPPFWSRANTYESLVWFILEQQVSLASAKAALEKLRARVGTIIPEDAGMATAVALTPAGRSAFPGLVDRFPRDARPAGQPRHYPPWPYLSNGDSR